MIQIYCSYRNTQTHLYSWHSEVWDLKFDCNRWFSLQLVFLHTGEAEVGSHQELFPSLHTHTIFRLKVNSHIEWWTVNRRNIQQNVLLLYYLHIRIFCVWNLEKWHARRHFYIVKDITHREGFNGPHHQVLLRNVLCMASASFKLWGVCITWDRNTHLHVISHRLLFKLPFSLTGEWIRPERPCISTSASAVYGWLP